MQSLKDKLEDTSINDSSAIVFAKTLPSHASISEEELELFILGMLYHGTFHLLHHGQIY